MNASGYDQILFTFQACNNFLCLNLYFLHFFKAFLLPQALLGKTRRVFQGYTEGRSYRHSFAQGFLQRITQTMQSSETLLRSVTPSPFSRTQHHVQATRTSRAQARLSAAHSKTDVISFRLTQILLCFVLLQSSES